MALFCILFSQLGIQLVPESIHFHESCHSFESFKEWICPLSHCVPPRQVNAAKSLVVSPYVQKGNCFESLHLHSNYFFVSVTFESVLWLHYLWYSKTLFQVSFRRCGINNGPPSTRLFLSTSSHHLGGSLRNKFSTLIFVCLNDKFSHSQLRFIIDL